MNISFDKIDHIDIVVTHQCNMKCPFCIDKFRGISGEIELGIVDNFLSNLRANMDKKAEVLLLGGEPTYIDAQKLIEIALIIKKYDFSPIISTNGVNVDTIVKIAPYYDWIQITTHSDKQTEFWRQKNQKELFGKINLKIAGDERFDLDRLNHFINTTKDFKRRSVSMYFKPDFTELCQFKEVWDLLDTLNWERNGSYLYSFYKGVRFKRCIKGVTNISDEPTVPKLYPNGCYNKTWNNEEMDNYLHINYSIEVL